MKHFSAITTGIAVIISLVLSGKVSALPNTRQDTTSAAFLCEKGLRLLDKKKYDDALDCFGRAFSAGMSKDSLCFFCAEAYFSKGAFDTALAFNFGIKAKNNSGLAMRQYMQRAGIYAALGWEKDAQAIKDSLWRFNEYRLKFLVPDISARAGFDYAGRYEREETSFPYLGPLETNIFAGPGFGGNLGLRWDVPLGKRFLLRLGTAGLVSSLYYRSNTSADSVNMSAGLMAGIEHKKSGFALEYGVNRVIDYLGNYSTQNSVALSLSRTGKKWLTYLSAGYEIELEAGLNTENQKCWLLGYFDQTFLSGKGFGFLVRGSGYFAKPITSMEYFRVMYVEDVSQKPVQHYYVDLPAQAPTSNPIPIGNVPYLLPATYQNNSLVKSAADLFGTPDVSLYPQNQVSLAPTVVYKRPLMLGVSASIGAGIAADYYTEKFRWVSFLIDKSVRDTFLNDWMYYYLARNAADGNYYWVKKLDNITSGEQFGDPVAISQHEKRRVDANLSAFVSLSRPVWKLGTLSLRLDAAKTYSTLRKETFLWWQVSDSDAPFSIPNWSYGISLTWNFNYIAQ
jgi:hypothetical protein